MDSEPSLFTAEHRRASRRALEVPIRVTVSSESIEGTTDNLSAAGVMFFTEEPLRVEVELEEDGQKRTFRGRLVRTQKISQRTTGFAIEFDPT